MLGVLTESAVDGALPRSSNPGGGLILSLRDQQRAACLHFSSEFLSCT